VFILIAFLFIFIWYLNLTTIPYSQSLELLIIRFRWWKVWHMTIRNYCTGNKLFVVLFPLWEESKFFCDSFLQLDTGSFVIVIDGKFSIIDMKPIFTKKKIMLDNCYFQNQFVRTILWFFGLVIWGSFCELLFQ